MLLNRDRALALMDEHDIAAIVGSTPENVTYLTGHVGWARRVYRSVETYGVLSSDPDIGSGLVIRSSDTTYFATEGSSAEKVACYGGRSALKVPHGYQPVNEEQRVFLEFQDSARLFETGVDALVHVLTEMGVTEGRIAVDEAGSRPAVLDALKERFPNCKILPAAGLLLMIRLVKTDEELDLLRRAAQINEDAIRDMLSRLGPGATEDEAAAAWRQSVARPGGMWHWLHLGSGPRSVDIFPPTNRVLRAGDLFQFDSGLSYHNYYSDAAGCGSIGEPTTRVMNDFRAIESGVYRALAIVREGVTGGRIFDTLVQAVRQEGLPDFEASFVGHTIGLEAREFPYILGRETAYNDPFLPPTSEIPLPANSTINVEAPFAIMGHGGYTFEISIVVKRDGWEPLISQDTGFHVVAA